MMSASFLRSFGQALLCVALLCAVQPTKADDKVKDLIKSTGFIEIKLVEAHVPDMDPLPMQKDSDVFVRVYLNDTKELVCESQVIQDENKPKVSCFSLFDSGIFFLKNFPRACFASRRGAEKVRGVEINLVLCLNFKCAQNSIMLLLVTSRPARRR